MLFKCFKKEEAATSFVWKIRRPCRALAEAGRRPGPPLVWSFDFATLAALSALPQPSASRGRAVWPRQAAASRRSFLTVPTLPFGPLKTLEPSLQLPAVALPAWPPQLWASCVATPGSGFAQKLPYRSAVWPPQNPRTFSAASSRRLASCGLPSSGLPAWPPQLWASCVATPGSGFAQKLPYRSETAVWPPQNPRTFSAASCRRLASVASPALGQLCGHARQRLRAEASLPFRDCRLAPSKPSNLLCSFQPSPCQLWPPQLWLASVASPALGQLCGHARQRLRAEASLLPFGPLKTLEPSLQLPAVALPAWPPQLWASCVATPGSGFAQKLPYRSETAVWPPQNPRTFSAASRTIHVSTVTCKNITGGLYQEFGTSRALMRFPSQTKKRGRRHQGASPFYN